MQQGKDEENEDNLDDDEEYEYGAEDNSLRSGSLGQ